jgi:hypothetical protein
LNLIKSFFQSRRLWGLTGTAVVLYFVAFVVFGKVDLSGIMPDTNKIARALIDAWPRMPFFAVQKEPAKDGKNEEVYYTVPTRQLTPQELAQMGVTNATAHPIAPKK